ncbi:hypothetical protein GOOTI_239_00440 [Gordonia otitidis NBRC 100426]|uniref:Uncharacterized protein n=1 Tax=Gordonia otitidis (strain DSM 44809 / CCUG 52243 / JCM 12355 / NBRC 100426 / IFM 10032) TaxID=1108044 RepID=H5TTI9_GORO1|nr:hypothetical protein GOOTI_239_00440 [Gordonia otitidis NBRC 100426]
MQIGGQRPEYGFDSWPPARALPTEGLATETRIERPMHPLPRVRDQIGKRNLRLVSLGLWLRSVLDRSDVMVWLVDPSQSDVQQMLFEVIRESGHARAHTTPMRGHK